MEQHDVVVVGGGPVGLTLALGLARQGVDVLVLEKKPGTAEHSRAPAIWPGMQEILSRLGMIARFEEAGICVPCIEMWDADNERVLVRLPIEDLREKTPYARLLILPQSETERLLYEAIRDTTSAEVRFSSEAVEITQEGSEVEVRYGLQGREERVRSRFVAGCDGAGSTVREGLGASFNGVTYDTRAALADVVFDENDDLPFPRMTLHPSLAVAIRIGPRLWRLILPISESDERRSLEERITDAIRNLFSGATYETVWKSEFRLHRRVSSDWADGRIVLAGDAAHLNSPVGAQGMNAGIMDADALTEAMLEALGTDDVTPLMDYVAQRRHAVEHEVNRFTDRLTRLLLLGSGRLIRPVLIAVSTVLRIKPLRRRILRRVAMLNPS